MAVSPTAWLCHSRSGRATSDHLFVEEQQFDRGCDACFSHHGGTGLLEVMDQGPVSYTHLTLPTIYSV